MSQVFFFSADKPITINYRKAFKTFIKKIFFAEGLDVKRIFFIFCSDNYILSVNQKYLKHDYFTDVITFLISKPGQPIDSEVYMSTQRIKENAKIYKVSYQTELLRVIIHSILHLCGYTDKSSVAKKIMRQKEDQYIKIYENSRQP